MSFLSALKSAFNSVIPASTLFGLVAFSLYQLAVEATGNGPHPEQRNLRTGLILLSLGSLLAILSLLADVIGIGAHPGDFGITQSLGTAAGIVIVLAGLVNLLKYRSLRR